MKTILFNRLIAFLMLLMPTLIFAQTPTMATTADFVLFSSNGAVSNSGISQLTGNVGTNGGSSTNFGNVNGVMDNGNIASGQCATDLHALYLQLNTYVATMFPAPALGNGDTLIAGVDSIGAASTITNKLYLNAKGNANAVFVIKIHGPLSAATSSKVILINGALACNVFWSVEGMVIMASGVAMKGTVIANNAAIQMGTGDTLEGRALSTTGAVSVDGVLAYTPTGCGSPTLTGPVAPVLNGVACYGIFSGNGAVTNSGTTHVTGDVGTNVGLTTGFNASDVTGTIHPKPDGSTNACAADLLTVYNYLNGLQADIELLYPAQFGNNLVLTPHTYIMKSAVTFTDTVYLNAAGDTSAVFVIQVKGAFSTSTFSKVILINGTRAKNVYWMIDGALNINNNSVFNGTIICNNGAINLNTGVTINGRALSTNGNVMTTAITTIAPMIPGDCAALSIQSVNGNANNEAVTIYPNPCSRYTNVKINDISNVGNCELDMYNVLGEKVMYVKLTEQVTTLNMGNLPSGIYMYKIISNDILLQTGKLAAQL
jgi:hypothetical protein